MIVRPWRVVPTGTRVLVWTVDAGWRGPAVHVDAYTWTCLHCGHVDTKPRLARSAHVEAAEHYRARHLPPGAPMPDRWA